LDFRNFCEATVSLTGAIEGVSSEAEWTLLPEYDKIALMRTSLKIIAIIVAAVLAYSILPVVFLYLQQDLPMPTNDQIADRLKRNKGEAFSFIVFGDNHAGFIFDDSAFLKIIGRINREDRFKKFNIDAPRSFMVGDSYTDVLAGNLARLETVFLGQVKYTGSKFLKTSKPDYVFNSLYDFAVKIKRLKNYG